MFNTTVQIAFFIKPTTKTSIVSVKKRLRHHIGVFLFMTRIIMICRKGILETIRLILCAVETSCIHIWS